jgi:hypothetical protein
MLARMAASSRCALDDRARQRVMRSSGGRWQRVPWHVSDVAAVSHITSTSAGDAWAIGSYPLIRMMKNADGSSSSQSTDESVLVHYVDGASTPYIH